MKKCIPFALLLLAIAGCAPRIYTASNFGEALRNHKTVAILPAEVSMQLRPNEARNMSAGQKEDMLAKMSQEIQEQMYGWLLHRSTREKYTVDFQDVIRTNARLKEAGIAWTDLKTTDRAKLAQLLGVDAVMQNMATLEKPMSEAAAVAVTVLTRSTLWGNTNRVNTTINIHDGASGNLLWKYDHEGSGSVGSSATALVDNLMRNASRKFPYKPAK